VRGFHGSWLRGRGSGEDVPRPSVEVSFNPGVTPAAVRARTLAKALALDLAAAADEEEREMILGELFIEVFPDEVLAGQMIIDLAGAVVHLAGLVARLEGDESRDEVGRILEGTFGEGDGQPRDRRGAT
jgi:hypothetical protein